MTLSRRSLLRSALACGCSLAASPFVTPVTFAALPSDNRLVVIILRGAMDGLDVVRPIGDKGLAGLRPDMVHKGEISLDGFYALHPLFADLAPMWRAGELGFAHAVSTPYRDKRSHFDGQDLLEAGFADLAQYGAAGRTGWLNRLLTLMPDSTAQTAFAVGDDELILLKGDAEHRSWAPGRSLVLSSQGQGLLQRIYAQDELFHSSADAAIELSDDVLNKMMGGTEGEMDEGGMAMMMQENRKASRDARRAEALARFSAEKLREETRIAAFSIGGWDTHRNQQGALKRPAGELVSALVTLKRELGRDWDKTAVLCMTEFGRTARQNGSAGTDHGTGGAMVLAGGAIKGGKVWGKWPGLKNADLYRQRDLAPMQDVRAYAAEAIGEMFGISATDIERTIFPNVQLESGLGIMRA